MSVAIVTGIAGGIGRASAILLAKKGYTVVGMGRSSEPDLSDFSGMDVTYLSGDVSAASDRQKLFDAAVKKGDIAVLVNVAGVAPKVRNDILEMTEESYDHVMNINTKGTLFLTQLVANQMVKQGKGGSIVNISSCSAYTSSTSRGEYCISKAGVSMITKLFADRLASEGITVNEVCPGIIETGMTATVKAKYDKLISDFTVECDENINEIKLHIDSKKREIERLNNEAPKKGDLIYGEQLAELETQLESFEKIKKDGIDTYNRRRAEDKENWRDRVLEID
jgi:NAD(P)-dependent dehydrogenase (short-subunit alcohol dehydrogenase family)